MINFYALYNKTGLDEERYAIFLEIITDPYTKDIQNSEILKPIEHIIKKDPDHAYTYAMSFLNSRWPEAEPYLMKDPEWAAYYARDILNGRWEDAEPYIMRDPYSAYYYAGNVLMHRWHEAEEYIKKSSQWWHTYCDRFDVL